jgi:hypothetical protein
MVMKAAWKQALESGRRYPKPGARFSNEGWSRRMNSYICEFTDGSFSPIAIGATWGKGECAGIAIRGDGFKRVVFFQDHPASHGPLMIPRDGDPWVSNIRRRATLAAVKS